MNKKSCKGTKAQRHKVLKKFKLSNSAPMESSEESVYDVLSESSDEDSYGVLRTTQQLSNFIRVAVLVSGNGSNLQALINSFNKKVSSVKCQVSSLKRKKLNPEPYPLNPIISLVVSNNSKAYGLDRAKKAGIETLVLHQKDYKHRAQYTKALIRELKKRKIDLVCLAGFMLILDTVFAKTFKNRILNIHPALLPAFGGKGMYGHHVHEAVLKSGAKFSGCTVHFVDEGCDTGPIALQARVPVLKKDTADTLAKRILKYEHRIYPQAVRLFAQGRLKIDGKRVKIK